MVLENDALAVRISSKGAELQSVVCEGIERMWSGDPAVWGRRAPLLFPLIGRLRDGWYANGGERVDAPMHGFCRDRAFAAEQVSGTHARFETTSDEGTRAVFPFDFLLRVDFSLEGATIVKTHTVENAGEVPMPFELGGHEAYETRLLPGERMADYYVRFEGADALGMFDMDEEGILALPKIEVPLEDGRLTKTPEQLGIDTVVLENVPGGRVVLASAANPHEVEVEFPDFPYLGIWTKAGQADARYLCLEPWSALPDALFSPRELAEKPGVRVLAPGERATLAYRMTFR
ncbi:MAG: aldose 1-epimerase family protein [Eggerthellaceae bacterium]|uniref:Aldose 1-epimerase family protein n=2 Tax=Gordonibacter urolithinfaciens TaxID=1335613 RepID=A0A423UM19_9ACTN|nr:aldose 1-epimerase family protein [Eggerthellaceae bacterium]MSA94204.1 aldose 1-epimerase family protein [Gordonibacter urolithinfaciens]ROT90368.1 aldose 1-epimerase family protein [Gordonibacter urolithinfaciens]ROT90895.1 aldose 1-epimerase family protein [Gordonibacter urolithinfaciens]